MAASGNPRQPRRGPAPFASFDHDVSDESSPETKQTFHLPEIREDRSGRSPSDLGEVSGTSKSLKKGETSEPDVSSESREAEEPDVGARLQAPVAPRIDISRASSSSHHDSRDSSPELALFAGGAETTRGQLELGFREDGALELRSSTEELAFLQAPGETKPAPRRHSRKDSQSSEVALLAVSGRTSRLSSVGSQCSAHSALSGFSHTSRVSRLSVVSGISRSPSPHKMLLETSFCGPRPIETDPEVCTAAVEEKLLEMAKMDGENTPEVLTPDTCDRREIHTEVTVEVRTTPIALVTAALVPSATPHTNVTSGSPDFDDNKRQKETKNKARVEERKARSRERRDPSISKTMGASTRSKDVIRIKLKPDDEYDDDCEDTESEQLPSTGGEPRPKPDSLDLSVHVRRPAPTSSPTPSRRRTPSPNGAPVSRKSSFCSLFKSREMIASPESPSNVLRRKKSLNDGRSRSKSRDRSATPTSATKIKGSVLSLFKTPRKSVTSPSPSSRDSSPVIQLQKPVVYQHIIENQKLGEKLKYYEDSKDGIIHIPLRTPPDEKPSSSTIQNTTDTTTIDAESDLRLLEVTVQCEPERPSMSAPAHRPGSTSSVAPKQRIDHINESFTVKKPVQRTVLPDGSIIIPLHSPTEKNMDFNPIPTTKAEMNQINESESKSVEINEQEKNHINLNKELDRKETVLNTDLSEVQSLPEDKLKKKERILFITHVGSTEQVFSTQLSITKTPSISSEISSSLPSFPDGDEIRLLSLRDTHITSVESTLEHEREPSPTEPITQRNMCCESGPSGEQARGAISPHEQPRDSSESEPSSEAAAPQGGNEVERRGLVVQESFEEELPYVPTTLPQERSLAVPMVPVRDRGGVRVAGTRRPRPTPGPTPPRAPPPTPSPAQPAPPADKLCIRLPRRPRTASTPAPARPLQRLRTTSASDGIESERRAKQEWIDFEEVPERRKQPKRIQTLPGGGTAASSSALTATAVVFSYVEPDQCQCECHALDSTQQESVDASCNTRDDGAPPDRHGAGHGAR